jgi:hypothetical protein
MEYAHLGAHKLGSLIVMNGSASPSSSIVLKPLSPSKPPADFTREEDFFTASEGEGRPSSVEDDDFGAPLPQRKYIELDGLPSQKERIERLPHRFMGSAANAAARSGSPLKHEVPEQSEECEDVDVDVDILLGPPETQPLPANHSVSLTAFLLEGMSDDEPEIPKVSPAVWHQSAISLASEYIADLPPSPYASAVDVSQYSIPKLESEATQISHDLVQSDEGFYDASPEFEESAQESFEELDESSPSTREITPEMALRFHPPPEISLKSALKTTRPPQTKSDSGYSSGYDSLHSSARSEQRPPVNYPVVPIYQHVPNSLEDATAVHTFQQMSFKSGPEEALQSLQGSSPSTKPKSKLSKAPERSKSWRKSMRKSLPRLLSSESATSLESKYSFDSQSTAKQPKQPKQPKKLQKKRPLSHQPLSTGFPRHPENGNVPHVPSDISARFTVRLATSPNMEHLERTYEGVSSGNSRFVSVSPGPDTLTNSFTFPDAERASRLLDDEPPPTPTHRYGLGTRGDRGRSKIVNDDEKVFMGISDFGTVAQSLGRSPYDVSTSGFQRRPLSAAATHPYQLSSLTPQFGPRQGWDDETAVRMAQMRRRERAAAAAAASMNEQSMNARPQIPERPRSHHGSGSYRVPRHIPSQESYIVVPQRPRSMYGDSPAQVPGLDLTVIHPREQPATFGGAQSIPRYETANFEHEQMPIYELEGDMPAPGTVTSLASQIHETSPAPIPSPSNSLNWSHQANIWRKRKLVAQTTVETTRASAPRSQKAPTFTTTTNTAIMPHPYLQQQAQPKALARQQQQQHMTPSAKISAVQDEQSISTLPTYSEEGIFGRYGGGTRHGTQYRGLAGTRDVSLATGGLREEWGVDLGDVPAARVAL